MTSTTWRGRVLSNVSAAGLSAAALLFPALAGAQASMTVPGLPPPSAGLLAAFYIIGGLTVLGAVATVTRRNPVVAAICLVGTLCSSAGLFLLLHATFLAAMQVLVYAGAIMVLFIFVIMAVEHPEREESGMAQGTVMKCLGALGFLFVFWRLIAVLTSPAVKNPAEVPFDFGDVYAVGRVFFGEYLFPFEAISVLLLTAIVGAVVVTRRAVKEPPAKPQMDPAGDAHH